MRMVEIQIPSILPIIGACTNATTTPITIIQLGQCHRREWVGRIFTRRVIQCHFLVMGGQTRKVHPRVSDANSKEGQSYNPGHYGTRVQADCIESFDDNKKR
jgi:hypothetical protein